jgi:hypothetical protein
MQQYALRNCCRRRRSKSVVIIPKRTSAAAASLRGRLRAKIWRGGGGGEARNAWAQNRNFIITASK